MTKRYELLLTENMYCTKCGAKLTYTETTYIKYNLTTGKEAELLDTRYWECPNKAKGIMQFLDNHLKFNDQGGRVEYFWQL